MADPTVGSVSVAAFVGRVRDYRYSVVGSLAWIAYDWVVCLEDEVELIWKSPNTPPKFMYLFSRYFGLLTISLLANERVLPSYCEHRLIFQAISYQLLLLSLELSLILRVYAIWERNKYVTWAIGFTFLLGEGWSIGLVIRAYMVIFPTIRPYPTEYPIWPPGCYVEDWPSWYRLCWVPTLVLETLLFVLNTIKCLSTIGWMRAPTVSRLFRDGSMYFAGLFVILLLDTISQYCTNNIVGFMIDTWIPAAMSFAGSRLLLSIRALYNERQRFGNVSAVESGAELSFILPRARPAARPADPETSPIREHSYPPTLAQRTRPLESGPKKSVDTTCAGPCKGLFRPPALSDLRGEAGADTRRQMSGWLAEWDCR